MTSKADGCDPRIHHRRSIRLKGYDYSQAGAYFTTVCTQDRVYMLGQVVDAGVRLTDVGRMVQSTWNELPEHYPGVEIDAFVIMPNHIHGIIVLSGVGAGPRARPHAQPRDGDGGAATGGRPYDAITFSLPDVVHRFKSLTTARFRNVVRESRSRAYPRRLWQRGYYERVIRNERDLQRIREYILHNPAHWEEDEENPDRARWRA